MPPRTRHWERGRKAQFTRQLAAGAIHQLIVWAPPAQPETDDQAQRDPFSVLSRVGAVFPRGDDDEGGSWPQLKSFLPCSRLRRGLARPRRRALGRRQPGGCWSARCGEENPRLHDRQVRLSNGWVIKIGRGLDIYQRPDDWLEIGANDLDLRPCLETTVDVFPDQRAAPG